MIGKLLRFIFLPKKSREALAARGRATPKAAGAKTPARASGASSPGDRERLLADAMAVYRKQRGLYDSLDEETRRQIEADAAKAFGDMAKPKS